MNKRYPVFDDCIHLERFTGCDYCAAKNLLAWASGKTQTVTVKNLLDGSIITIENASTPRFSPDGETLFYLSCGQMHLCHPDGTDARPLGQFAGPVIDPIWSPNGTRILFSSAKSGSIGASADSAPAKHPGGPATHPWSSRISATNLTARATSARTATPTCLWWRLPRGKSPS